jgi:hypothetical protein
MSINWDIVTTSYASGRPLQIPTYGNYGGEGYTEGVNVQAGQPRPNPEDIPPPVDALDELFAQHDRSYDAADGRPDEAQQQTAADVVLIGGEPVLNFVCEAYHDHQEHVCRARNRVERS